MRITEYEHLEGLARAGLQSLRPERTRIAVGTASCGAATGGREVLQAVRQDIEELGLDIDLRETGCIGFCQVEPVLEVRRPGEPRVLFHNVDARKARQIIHTLVTGRMPVEYALCWIPLDGERPTWQLPRYDQLPFYAKQQKIVLRNCGLIDPESLAEYAAGGGYRALWRALTEMSPDEVIAEVERAGLRGRGGAGFPTARKWRLCRLAAGEEKFVVCNADEGDPGAYMDRAVLEGDPHSVLEGMAIGAYAIGASEGYIYVRDEYPLAILKLERAIADAGAAGLLGRSIFGRPFNFNVYLARGGGAFVCGEETSLLQSIEGKMGEPNQRPPFPAQKGLWDKPTNVNNVETWANVPEVVGRGSTWFAGIGTGGSKGTKVFSLVGKIQNTGLVEVPMGITLREIVFDIGGGVLGGKKFKAVQTGGPSGGCIPEKFLDLPVDFDELSRTGSIMGSGGMIVMDEGTCMVDVARYFLDFLKEESCGKCVPCREGIDRMLEILARICNGEGRTEDLVLLEEFATTTKDFSLCGLGGTAPNPVLTTLQYFRDEYEAHIRERRCPAAVCRALVKYSIQYERCNDCGACLKLCPTGAIVGYDKRPHYFHADKCIKCGACLELCKPGAITVA
ncbi:MAG: NADH-quinone oxidoreductase subunit NuoF [Deltaproteobacteria bacterium]|nr:NADH-quinone oxidoreductase subunit NuoF [Deltaproteobacteria bacterium]